MTEEENNPGHITPVLCEAYRKAIMAEFKGLRNTIIVGLSISTAVISLFMWILNIGGT